MLSIAIGSISIIMMGYFLKKYIHDLSKFESEILSSSPTNQDDASLSFEAIKQALENKHGKDE